METAIRETFTKHLDAALLLSQDAAANDGASCVGSRHLILGIVARDNVAVRILNRLDVFPSEIQKAIGMKLALKTDLNGCCPRNEQQEEILCQAVVEARRLRCKYVGTEHLLLALVGDSESQAGDVLSRLGVDWEQVYRAIRDYRLMQ